MPIIKLKSSDDKVFEVDVKVAQLWCTIKTMLQDLGMIEDDEEPIPLSNVTGSILGLVVKWSTYHKDDVSPANEDEDEEEPWKKADDICEWDREFLKELAPGTLLELALAANYLDVNSLMNLTCKTIASMIRGKTPAQIKEKFNLNDSDVPMEEDSVCRQSDDHACKDLSVRGEDGAASSAS